MWWFREIIGAEDINVVDPWSSTPALATSIIYRSKITGSVKIKMVYGGHFAQDVRNYIKG